MSDRATPVRRQALAVALALLGTLLAFGGSDGSRAQTKANRKNTAASDPQAIDFAGYQKLLETHRGKPVLVNFWATWCEPCRDEFPMLSELARQHAPQGLTVIGVSLDEDVDINLVRHFLKRMNPAFPNYRKKPGKDEPFINGVDAKWGGALPATFFYDREGRRMASLVGEHKRAEFDTVIERLLGAPAP